MSKYIIEIAEEEPFTIDSTIYPQLYKAVGFKTLVFDEEGLKKLVPYYEESAYIKGQEYGYKRGLDDSWDAAKKLMLLQEDGGYTNDEVYECFGEQWRYDLFKKCRPEEAVERIREYEERKTQEDEDTEVKVGDEVEYEESGYKCGFVVTHINPEVNPIRYSGITTFDKYGVLKFGEPAYYDADKVRKTGQWIRNDNGTYSCSLCQAWIPEEQHYYARFCLRCGAYMKGSNINENKIK